MISRGKDRRRESALSENKIKACCRARKYPGGGGTDQLFHAPVHAGKGGEEKRKNWSAEESLVWKRDPEGERDRTCFWKGVWLCFCPIWEKASTMAHLPELGSRLQAGDLSKIVGSGGGQKNRNGNQFDGVV